MQKKTEELIVDRAQCLRVSTISSEYKKIGSFVYSNSAAEGRGGSPTEI